MDTVKKMAAGAVAIGLVGMAVQPVLLKLLCIGAAILVGVMALWRYIDYYNEAYDAATRRRTDAIIAALAPLPGIAYFLADAVNPTFYGVFIHHVSSLSGFGIVAFACFIFYSAGAALSSYKPITKMFVGFSIALFVLSFMGQGNVSCDDGDDESGSCTDQSVLHHQQSTGSGAGLYIIYLTAAYVGLAGVRIKREKAE